MELADLLKAIIEHNNTKGGYQIHLNSGDLDDRSNKHTGVEFSDLYFTECTTLSNTTLLCFGNMNRKPISQKEDGTNLYPSEINSQMFIDINKIKTIEDVKDFEDWFLFPSERVINIYMLPENEKTNCRNVVTIGFME